MFGVNSTLVVGHEGVSDMNTTADRAVLYNLRLHLVNSLDLVVFAHVVFLVGDGAAIGKVTIDLGHWGHAVSAQVHSSAIMLRQVGGSVLLARAVGNAVLVGELVNASGVTTVAAATSLAVDDGLSVQTDGG